MNITNKIEYNARTKKRPILCRMIAAIFSHEQKSYSTPMSRGSAWGY